MSKITQTRKKTVVICDDQAALLTIFKHLLSSKGFDVQTAGDGDEGLDLVRSYSPDLLVLDLGMPAADGFAVLESLKGLNKPPYTIVVTGYEDDERRERASKLGAREVWKKPFNAGELMTRIDALLAQGLI